MAIRLETDRITPSLQRIDQQLRKLAADAFDVFYKNTPRRSGNARSKTRLAGSEIIANYPYAERLDDGYSRQSPDGMTKPTEEFIERRTRQIFRRGRWQT